METQKREKHLRKRKKKLLNSIRKQIEFYFSDANLRHDRFMRQLVAADDEEVRGRQSVDLTQFLKFNKISEMTENVRDICLAVESSQCLSLDEDKTKVKRKEPFLSNDTNYEESTIYVERLPPNADQQWIRSHFGSFGPIEYIKIPHFRHNNTVMGFAFIEFSEPESAKKALKHFNSLSSHHNKNQTQLESDPEVNQIDSTSKQQNQDIPRDEVSRKRLPEDNIDKEVEPKRAKICDNDSNEKTETNEEKTETQIKKKKKRKRKRKTVPSDPIEDNVSEVINLRVMSKKEWKQWKNKYLKLQKESMSAVKRSLLIDNHNKVEEKTVDNKTMDTNDSQDMSYESGLIIKLNFSMPSKHMNESLFKRNIRQIGGKTIQYIDLPLNQLQFTAEDTVRGVCYVRTNNCDDTNSLIQNPRLKQLAEFTVLEGNEEKDYWNQIFEQRIKKKSNTYENHDKHKTKTRGFDKIMNRMEGLRTSVETKLNKHIKFTNA